MAENADVASGHRALSSHEALDQERRRLLEAVPQQIFVLRPDFTIEYANQAILV